MHGFAQTAFQPGVFIEAELDACRHQRREMRAIVRGAGLYRLKLRPEIGTAGARNPARHLLKIDNKLLTELVMIANILFVLAQQKVLLCAPHLQHRDVNAILQLADRPSPIILLAKTALGGVSHPKQHAEQQHTADAEHTD